MLSLFALLFDVPFCLIGILGNTLLITIVCLKTPKQMRSYSVLILNLSASDLITCLTTLMCMPRIIPVELSLGFVFPGPCSLVGSKFCYYIYCVFLHTMAHTQWMLLVSFVYRLYVLYHPAPKLRYVILVVVSVYLPSLFQCISYMLAYGDEKFMRNLLKKTFGYTLENVAVAGNDSIFAPLSLFTILYLTLPYPLVNVAVFKLRQKILQRLQDSQNNMSETTLKLHTQLVLALTLNACLPVVYLAAVAAYGLMQLRILHTEFQESFVFACVLVIPTISPWISLTLVSVYKKAVISMFWCKKHKVADRSLTMEKTFTSI